MGIEIRKTTCVRDCPDACGIVAEVDGDRILRLGGDPDHPVTAGFLCYRTNSFVPRNDAPDRLRSPLIRRGGKGGALEPASWDEALDLLADRLSAIRDESGPEAVFHYRSGGSLGLTKQVLDRFWEAFGPVTVKRGDICSGAGEAAQETDFGVCDSHAFFDLERSRHILLWGKNPVISGPHLVPVLRRSPATLTLIDVVQHEARRFSDHVVQPRPAGDYDLAMAVARILFETGRVDPDAASYCNHLDAFRALCLARDIDDWCARAGVDVAAANLLADQLADGPTAILVGWGMTRRRNGGAIVRALDALGAISGNVGVPGGGVSYYFARRSPFTDVIDRRWARRISEPRFGPELLAADPPVRALWITCGNPVAMLPETETIVQALDQTELVVVVDAFHTDTCELADVVLPCGTFLEADDVLGAYGHHWLGVARPIVPLPEGARDDLAIVQGLAERLGLADVVAGTPREWQARIVGDMGVTLEQLEAGPVLRPNAPDVLFADRRFPTPSGKVELIAEPPPEPARVSAEYPLMLMALSTRDSQSSLWSKPEKHAGPLPCRVHPDAAAAAGLTDGQTARLESTRGALTVVVVVDPHVHPEAAVVPKGGHRREGRCANALIAAELTDLGEGGALYDEPVRLACAPGAAQ